METEESECEQQKEKECFEFWKEAEVKLEINKTSKGVNKMEIP